MTIVYDAENPKESITKLPELSVARSQIQNQHTKTNHISIYTINEQLDI